MGKISDLLIGKSVEVPRQDQTQDTRENVIDIDTQKQLIDNGAMCPKCKSQDVMVLGGKRSVGGIIMLGIFAKKHPEIVCKNCGNRWKVKTSAI